MADRGPARSMEIHGSLLKITIGVDKGASEVVFDVAPAAASTP